MRAFMDITNPTPSSNSIGFVEVLGKALCIMAYGSTPYVRMTLKKKMAATIKVHK